MRAEVKSDLLMSLWTYLMLLSISGFVSVLEVGVGLGGGLYSMTPLQSFERRPDEDSLVTSLAYFSHHTHLAAATEIGEETMKN